MKQIAQYQDGRLELQEVPAPVAPPGGILVRTTHSVISPGTEKMKVEQARMNLLQKARARPDQVRKVLQTAKTLGWRSAWEKVKNRLESPTPLGYSAAGEVVAVDQGNQRFRVGDRVACAGAECAFHAEYIALPDLLAARVPDGVPGWQAAYTTLCAIAMHAARQSGAALGERVIVMGQGLVGLLVTNILKAGGARVMAVELQPARRPIALAMGAEKIVIPGEQNLDEEVRAWTDGFGADAAIICTATRSNTPVEQAAESLRDRGRLVDVGITRLDLPWKLFYEKEIEVRFSRSYGPGRYDPDYEWGGADYPIGYVRWTEQRNFEASLDLMKKGALNLAAVTTRRVPFDQAPGVYAELVESSRDIGVILEYPGASREPGPPAVEPAPSPGTRPDARAAGLSAPVEAVDVIGAGNFVRTMLLPHLKGQIPLGTVVNQTALSANHAKTKFEFAKATTDVSEIWKEPGRRAVLIGTRHNLHAVQVKQAIEAGRQVFVEKPLCLSVDELREIDGLYARSNAAIHVGFNRRFAPASVALKKALKNSPGPRVANYRVHAGPLDPTHWFARYEESGGRILGEACHFLDYFCFLFDSRPVRVTAQAISPRTGRVPFPDSFTAQVEFADGSCGQLIYSAAGDFAYPKESLTVFAAGVVAEMENFQALTIYHQRRRRSQKFSGKGHAEQMAAWLGFLRGQTGPPLSFEEARTSMQLTFSVLEAIRQGTAVGVTSTETLPERGQSK